MKKSRDIFEGRDQVYYIPTYKTSFSLYDHDSIIYSNIKQLSSIFIRSPPSLFIVETFA